MDVLFPLLRCTWRLVIIVSMEVSNYIYVSKLGLFHLFTGRHVQPTYIYRSEIYSIY